MDSASAGMGFILPIDRNKLRVLVNSAVFRLIAHNEKGDGVGCVDSTTLDMYAEILSPEEYDMVLEERVLLKGCALPTCSKSCVHSSKARISAKERNISQGMRSIRSYCSKKCLLDSEMYRSSLSEDPVYMRRLSPDLINALLPKEETTPSIDSLEQEMDTMDINELKVDEDESLMDHLFNVAEEQRLRMFPQLVEEKELDGQELCEDESILAEEMGMFTIDSELVSRASKELKKSMSPFAAVYQFALGISKMPVKVESDAQQAQRRVLLNTSVQKQIPKILVQLGVPLEKHRSLLGKALQNSQTLYFRDPIPSLSSEQWTLYSLVFLDSDLGMNSDQYQTILQSIGFSQDHFSTLKQTFYSS